MRSTVYGPYRHGAGYRLVVHRQGKASYSETVLTEEEALRMKAALEAELRQMEGIKLRQALDDYAEHLRQKGNKPSSVEGTLGKLALFFGETDITVSELTPTYCVALYKRLTIEPRKNQRVLSVDSHRGYLAGAKTFLTWVVAQRWLRENPLKAVVGIGRRRRGKAQLGIDESRALSHKALELAKAGDLGALAVLLLLWLGLRASELVNLRARDVDDEGRVLWIRDPHDAKGPSHLKTRAARRAPAVPTFLRRLLVQLAKKTPLRTAPLFGEHWRDWPRLQTARLCRLAGVPVVTAHGLRGMRATLSLLTGENPDLVARKLGHTSSRITFAAYAAPGTRDAIEQDRLTRALSKKPSSAKKKKGKRHDPS